MMQRKNADYTRDKDSPILQPMSALPPKADIAECDWDVRFVPKADIRILFEQLIGALLEKWRYVETERFGGL